MRRSTLVITLAIVALIVLSAIIIIYKPGVAPSHMTRSAEEKIVVLDSAGREVVFTKSPDRVIVLHHYWAEVLYCLGLSNKIVGIDIHTSKDQFLPKEIREKTQVGSVFRGINWEMVIKLDPDLIIMGLWHGSFTPKEQAVFKKAEELGIPVLAFGIPITSKTNTTMPYENIRIIRVIGKVFGVEERAEELAKYLENYYNKALEISKNIPENEKRNVLVIYGSFAGRPTGSISISYKGSAYAETVELIGAYNIAFNYNFTSQYPKLDLEKLIAYFGDKTDVLIVVDWEIDRLNDAITIIKSDPKWQGIKAVKDGYVVGIFTGSGKLEAVSLYGPRFITGIYAFGYAIYPEYYPNWEPIYKELLQKFYNLEG